jgi:deoxyribonuclease-1-like protein
MGDLFFIFPVYFMKRLFFTFLFYSSFSIVSAQITLCSWNLENFGKSKKDSVIEFIANTVKGFDVVAIVEVVAGNGGPQAVARLADALNLKGTKWDYCISEPTVGMPNKSERYAFIWKTSKLKKVGDAWLEKKYNQEIEREPYYATFASGKKEFTVAAFHAITKAKQPETEIKYFKFLPEEYPGKNIVFCGDFNCSESHTVFNTLKTQHYKPVFTCQKTSLKMECKAGNCLASEYDNIFYNSTKTTLIKSGVIHFYKEFSDVKKARIVSDHLPVFFEFSLN